MGEQRQDDSTRSNQQQGGKTTSQRSPGEMGKGNQDAGTLGSTSGKKENPGQKEAPGSRPA